MEKLGPESVYELKLIHRTIHLPFGVAELATFFEMTMISQSNEQTAHAYHCKLSLSVPVV